MIHKAVGDGDELRGGPSAWSRGWRLVAGAVVVVLIGVTAFALVAVATPRKATTKLTEAEVTRASGPDRRPHAGFVAGTVATVNGATFTVTVPKAATPKSVSTSSSTVFTSTTTGTVADATVGSLVVAEGMRGANGSLAAADLAVLPSHSGGGGGGSGSGAQSGPWGSPSQFKGGFAGFARLPFAFGTVTANSGGTLTLSTPFGTQTVTTSASTKVTVTAISTLAAVTPGVAVQAAGTLSSGGVLDARVVHTGMATLGLDPGGFGAGGHIAVPGTSATTNTTATTVATTAGSGAPLGSAPTTGHPGFLSGTVATLTGSGFTLSVTGSTTPKTVTTTATTQFTLTGSGSATAATVGSEVLASGQRQADGSLAATKLTILPTVKLGASSALAKLSSSAASALSGLSGLGSLPGLPAGGLPFVFGTVTANTGGTLTVSTPFGSETVTISGSTAVTATATVTLGSITVGATVQVSGTLGANGSLTAQFVHIGSVSLGLTGGASADTNTGHSNTSGHTGSGSNGPNSGASRSGH